MKKHTWWAVGVAFLALMGARDLGANPINLANGWTLVAPSSVTVANVVAMGNTEQDFTLNVPFASMSVTDVINLILPQANAGQSGREEFFNITLNSVNNTTATWYDYEVFNIFDFNVARGTKPQAQVNPTGRPCPYQGNLGATHPAQAHIHPASSMNVNPFKNITPNTRCGVFGGGNAPVVNGFSGPIVFWGGGTVAPGGMFSATLRFHDGVVPGDPQGTDWAFPVRPTTPEPGTWLLFGSGLLGIVVRVRGRLAL